jgi:hypothetical protein
MEEELRIDELFRLGVMSLHRRIGAGLDQGDERRRDDALEVEEDDDDEDHSSRSSMFRIQMSKTLCT